MSSERFPANTFVELKNLIAKPENNGRQGYVKSFLEDIQKYEVMLLSGNVVKVKPENLTPSSHKKKEVAPADTRRSRSRSKGRAAASEGGASSKPGNPTAKFHTSEGDFEAEIFLDRVPITASSFIDLCKTGFYEGIHFHRVIPGFMNQFGCPNAKDPKSQKAGQSGPPDGTFKNLKTGGTERRSNGGNIQDENISKDTNAPGSLSMANTGRPNSGGSQFFMNVAHNANLDWFSPGQSKHPVFGKIIKGMDVVMKISKVKTIKDNPVQPIRMIKISISDA